MNLTIAQIDKTKPQGIKSRGRQESAEWAPVAEAIMSQTPGEWVTYDQFNGTTEAVRVAARLRTPSSFEPGRAFAPLKGNIQISLTNRTEVDGKSVGRLAICWNPAPVKATKVTAPTGVKKAPAKRKPVTKK